MTFHINQRAYSVDIGEDEDNKIQKGIEEFLKLDENIDTRELLLAYIKKTYQLVQLENSLEDLSLKIDDIS